jgi:hypothetical protein
MSGTGQRFVDAGYLHLKPLIKVAGKPIVEHAIGMFPGAKKIICIINRDHEQKEILISELLRINPDITVVEISQHKLGPGHAIVESRDFIDPDLPTLVSYCDWAGDWDVNEMLDQLANHEGSILTYTGFNPHMMRNDKFAYVKKVKDFVVDIQEKESYTDAPMEEEASSGCYGFASGRVLLQALDQQIESKESLNGEYYISLTYRNLLQRGNRIGTVLMKRFFQWGTPEDLQDWEYWNSVIQQLPGTISESINAHNIVLAAGRGLRIAELAKVSKPNLVISGKNLWEYSAPEGITFRSNRIVTRPEVGITKRDDVEVVLINKVTEGQAISARIGINSIENPEGASINVLSSDNAFTPEVFAQAADLVTKNDLVIWTSTRYPLSELNPSQFSWVNLSEKKVILKSSPPNFIKWEMIIGSFTFRNRTIALSLIDELIAQDIRVNNEFYLDSIINLAFARNMRVITLEVHNFIAIGTPEELLTHKYFANGGH